VVWVWIAVILMGIGGLAALVPHRNNARVILKREDAEEPPAINAAPVGSGSYGSSSSTDPAPERA
jgi:hypothetical protein